MKGTTVSEVNPDLKNEEKGFLKNSTSESPAKKQKFKCLSEFWGGGPSSNVLANINTIMRTIPQQRLPSDLDLEKPRLLEISESSVDRDFVV